MENKKKIILSVLLVISLSLLSITTTIYIQTASAFFHEKLFGGSNTKPGDITEDKPANKTTTGSSTQTSTPKDDNIKGSAEDDVLVGLAGNDVIDGQRGNDNINGSEGDDYLIGGQGANTVNGGVGNDTLIGGPNSDTLTGREGQDIFVCNQGNDKVLDFNATEGDIRLNGCEDNDMTGKQTSNGNVTGTTNMTAGSNNNTITTDETPKLGETGDILSDLNLTP